MAEPVADLHLSEYVDIVKRRRLVIALTILAALAAAITLSALQTPQYRAEARVRVEAAPTAELDATSNLSSNVRDRNLENEVDFARSDRVRARARELLGESPRISVSPSGTSDTLEFSAVSTDPERAAEVANSFADAYVEERSANAMERYATNEAVISARLEEIEVQRAELQSQLIADPLDNAVLTQIANLNAEEARRRSQLTDFGIFSQLNQTAAVSILNRAVEPRSAFSPSWPRNILLGLVAGSILALGAALLLETLDDTLLNSSRLERASNGLPVLGAVPPPSTSRRSKERVLVASQTGAFTEAFRSLRSAIELGQKAGEDVRSILVTSANPSEGKSTVVAHLALSFARSGLNVLVIDADMHNPSQHDFFRVENINGLGEHLSNTGEAEIVTERATGQNLVSLIPAGTSPSSPAELLSSLLAQEFVMKLSSVYDLVLIDSPPLRPVADTPPLARIADATLLVAMRGKTTSKELQRGLELLARAQTIPFGTVLCGADRQDSGYGYGYGYGFGYGDTKSKSG